MTYDGSGYDIESSENGMIAYETGNPMISCS